MDRRKQIEEQVQKIWAQYDKDSQLYTMLVKMAEWADAFWINEIKEVLSGSSNDSEKLQKMRQLVSSKSS